MEPWSISNDQKARTEENDKRRGSHYGNFQFLKAIRFCPFNGRVNASQV